MMRYYVYFIVEKIQKILIKLRLNQLLAESCLDFCFEFHQLNLRCPASPYLRKHCSLQFIYCKCCSFLFAEISGLS